jgi:hypothetical protein
VYAPGGPVLVKGTELALIVDPAQRASVLYVREGVVRLERYPGLQLPAGQVFRLREGSPPDELSDEALRMELEQQFAFHSSTIWEGTRKPLWKQKKFYAISGVAAAAVGVAVWQHGRSEAQPRRPGTVLVHIPL